MDSLLKSFSNCRIVVACDSVIISSKAILVKDDLAELCNGAYPVIFVM